MGINVMNLLTAFGLLLFPLVGISPGHSHSPNDPRGAWNGVLFVDSVGHVPRRPAVNRIHIDLILEPRAPTAARLTTQIANPTHVGTARGNFRQLNTGLPNLSYLAHAVQKPGDTLVVAINPMSDHGAIRLTGHFDGKTFRGTWLVTDYAQGLSGHFELKRLLKK